jgi:phosphohistidine phosphatase
MKIYLVQHGEAKSEKEAPERPLTNKGKQEVDLVARYVARCGIEVTEILHSSRLRAKQTAELFAQYLSPPQGIREVEGLAPLDDLGKAQELVQEAEKPLMIVGHLPHLGRLASLLVLGTPVKEIVKFTMGGIVCLNRSDNIWSIQWALIPELIGK